MTQSDMPTAEEAAVLRRLVQAYAAGVVPVDDLPDGILDALVGNFWAMRGTRPGNDRAPVVFNSHQGRLALARFDDAQRNGDGDG